jgi:hypothetical protein
MAETVSEARVAELIQAAIGSLQQTMSAALRAEFGATAVAAESRLMQVQTEMSADLRREFETTREAFEERVRALTNSIDVTISKKFDAADEIFKAQTVGQQKALEHSITELTEAWSRVDSGHVKTLSEALEAKTTEDEERLQHVKDILEDSFEKFKDKFDVHPAKFSELPAWKVQVEKMLVNADTALAKHWNLIDPALSAFRHPVGGNDDDLGADSSRPRRSRGLDVRVQDPRNWSLDVLNDGDKIWCQ